MIPLNRGYSRGIPTKHCSYIRRNSSRHRALGFQVEASLVRVLSSLGLSWPQSKGTLTLNDKYTKPKMHTLNHKP